LDKTKDLQPLKDKWSRLKYVVGLCILLMIAFNIGSFLRFVFSYIFDIPYTELFLGITETLIQMTAFIVVIVVGLKDQNKTLASVCFLKKANGVIWFSAILCAVGYTLFIFYVHDLFYDVVFNGYLVIDETEGNFFINLIHIAIIPAIAEEVLFKGIIFPILKKHFNVILAVIITSLLFAACHLSFILFIFHFLFSCYTFWLYLKSGNLIIPMIIHFTNNLFTFVLVNEPFAELGTFYAALVLLISGSYLLYNSSKKSLSL